MSRYDGPIDKFVQVRNAHGDININCGPPDHPKPPPRQVGPPVRPYVNNRPQLSKLKELLTPGEIAEPRIALVRGGPGSGRSALVTEVANDRMDDFPDGVFAVRFGSRDDELARLRLGELLMAVGFDSERIPDSVEGRSGWWRSWSRDKSVLLILDDVVRASQVRALRPGRGRSAVAVVDAGFGWASELGGPDREVQMEPMSDETALTLLKELTADPAMDAASEDVARLLSRCAGSVTALTAVGLLLREKSPARLARMLAKAETALRALSQHDDVAVAAVFDAAYHRLDHDALAQSCYRLLGVHPLGAGVTADAVAAILGTDSIEAEFALDRLVRVGLAVELVPERYQIASPQLVRPHAALLLRNSGEEENVKRRIIAHYLMRAVACSRAWMPRRIWLSELWGEDLPEPERDREEACEWLRTERANLLGAVEMAYALEELDSVCRFAVALWPLHNEDKFTADMVTVCGRAAHAADELAMPLVASVVRQQLAFAHRERRDFDRAVEIAETARRNAEEAGSELAYYSAVETLGLVHRDQGDPERAWQRLKENYEFAQGSDDPRRAALAVLHFGSVARDPRQADALFDQAAAELDEEAYNSVKVALWRGRRMVDFGRLDEAAGVLADVAERAEAGSWNNEHMQACRALAELARARHDVESERAHLTRALEIAQVWGFGAHRDEVIARLEQMPPLPR